MVKIKAGLIIILLSAILTSGVHAAALHGTIYEWSDFEKPLKNAIVEVNSTPLQYTVSTTGTYSFNLSPGNYSIRAKYYRNNILEYAAEEEMIIDKEGDFIHDILLFPPTDPEDEMLGDINLTKDIDMVNDSGINDYFSFILVFVLLIILFFYFLWKKKSRIIEPVSNESAKIQPIKTGENRDEAKREELPADLKDLYDLILGMGGRTTQKEIRKKIAFSEAKVSLMIADLEDRGLIKKIRRGRSNIIIAENKK
ncbi:MAG: hypothetical protein FIB08_13420 [Candidatus Methanoperedens sp.]|nr:hypothetical protein [Candidatus Methanoperedens sp.]